ncbi:MAG: SLC13 family permease [Ilumatobacteraceae bacterium]
MSDIGIVYCVLGAVVVLFVWNRLPVEIVAIGAALTLAATGVLTVDESLAGLGDQAVIFIATLFVVSEGLDATGVTTWAGQRLIASVGESRPRLIVLTMLLVAGLTALISVNGAVAALLPMVVVIALRLGRAPSQLLMPLAFAAHAGSQLALTGSPVNILVSEAADDVSGTGFGFVEFAIVGVPLLAGTIAVVVLLGTRLLPHRVADVLPPDLSAHALTLVEQYSIPDHIVHLRVPEESPVVGRRADDLDLSGSSGVELLGVQRRGADGHQHAMLGGRIEAEDIVLLDANRNDVAPLVDRFGLDASVAPPLPESHAPIVSRDHGLVEVVVAPRSQLAGQVIFPGMLTASGELVVLAVQRKGNDLGPEPVTLAVGDTLLVQGTWKSIEANVVDTDILVVDDPDLVRRQTVAFGSRAPHALAVLGGMVTLLATGAVAPAVAGLLAALAMVLLGVVDVHRAYRAISWTTVILVGAMIPLSTALQKTGAAAQLAEGLVDLVGDSPYLLLAGLFLLTAVLGQLISNTATALVVIPIAVSAAAESNVSERPLLMGVCAAASAAFLTPVATPVNLMVMGPGAYRFGDYWKLGGVLLAWFFVVVMIVVPLVWRF